MSLVKILKMDFNVRFLAEGLEGGSGDVNPPSGSRDGAPENVWLFSISTEI